MPTHHLLHRRRGRYDRIAVLAYVTTYQQQHRQRSPSERQIQAALGVSAPSVVHNILRRLQQAGLLTTTRYGRGLTVDHALTPAGHAAVAQWRATQAVPDRPDPPTDP